MTNHKSRWLPSSVISDFIRRRPYPVLLGILLITLFFAWHIPDLSFRTSIYDLVIDELPETSRYEDFKRVFGSDEIIRIVIRAENIFDPATFMKIGKLSESASQIKGVRRVISLPGIKKAVDRGRERGLEEFSVLLGPIALFDGNLISEDHRNTALTLVLNSDADKTSVIKDVEILISESSDLFSIYQIGMPLVSKALADYTQQDFYKLPPITLILVAVILFLLFRNLTFLLLPILCVALSLTWTFGLMALTGTPLSILTMIVPVFLIAVGTAYCLHVCAEYQSLAQTSNTSEDAVASTFNWISFPVVLATITTVIGIGSLMVNKITAIREFALFASFGMVSLMVLIMTFFPAMLLLVPLPANKKAGISFIDQMFNRILKQIVRINLYHQKTCFIIIGLITCFCVVGISFISVETNPVGFFKKDTQIRRNFNDIYEKLSGSFPVNVVMGGNSEDWFESIDHIADIDRLQKFLETLPGIDKTISFSDYLKLVNYVTNQYDPEYYTLPVKAYQLRILINEFKSLLGSDVFSSFINHDFSSVNILMLTHISSSEDFLSTRENVLNYVGKNFSDKLTWDVTGLGVVVSASSHLLTVGQVKSLSISIILIFCIMVLLFLSGKVGLIAIVPNCFPIIVSFGLIGWLDLKLSIATSLIASIAIGLAVDDTIHYMTRYNNEFKKDLDKDNALRNTIMSVGKPIIFTTLTIGIGFSILMFSHFQPTAVFGLLMVITMLSALVGDLILLPSLMLHVELITAWDLLKLMPISGGITPGIVHELNQPLNAIKVGSEFMKMVAKKGGKIQEKVLYQVTQEISEQVDRASEIINRLSEVGEKPNLISESVLVNRALHGTSSIFSTQLKLDNIELELELDETLPPIQANYNRLVQVIFNLVNNGRDAINEKKSIYSGEDNGIIKIRSFREKKCIGISISDSGTGIPEQFISRIFEPFFTTREEGKGRGLGLSVSKEIVREFNGRIKVTSKEGEGTTVNLLFPV